MRPFGRSSVGEFQFSQSCRISGTITRQFLQPADAAISIFFTVRRVLVVDDYPGARYRRMRILAEDGGFEVMEEFLGRPAVQRALNDHVDVVLVDLHLPDITGLEVCRAIRENPGTAKLPVLLISAVAEQDQAATLAQASGANGFLPDSVEPSELVAAIRKALAG